MTNTPDSGAHDLTDESIAGLGSGFVRYPEGALNETVLANDLFESRTNVIWW